MKNKERLKKLLAALLAAAVCTALFLSGWLYSADASVSDALYQRAVGADGEIVVIGMDQRAADLLGPMPWPRSVMADVIYYLNETDPDKRPAVIGIDVLYIGESGDPEADADLAAVCEDGGNVVVAAAATFGSELVETDDGFYMDPRAVLAFDTPFDALADSFVLIVLTFIVMAGLMAWFILMNLSDVYMLQQTPELVTMRVNGFTQRECLLYAAAEPVVTTAAGILVGVLLGARMGGAIALMLEQSSSQSARDTDWRTVVFSILITAVFSLIINAISLRRVRTLRLSQQ